MLYFVSGDVLFMNASQPDGAAPFVPKNGLLALTI
jgi:hypothetical protein